MRAAHRIDATTPRASIGGGRHIFAICAGNALEFYEFVIYATFAVYIGHTFFPPGAPGGALLLSLATFGAGFLTRPIGGWVLGRYADRRGRKPAMLVSLALMAAGMIGVAITPGYAVIGAWAPVIVLAARLLQGFALGGELGASTAYLVEASDDRRRGMTGSLQGVSQSAANLAAAGAGFALAVVLPQAVLETWGWRLAMLPGLLALPLALRIRRELPETLTSHPPVDAPPIYDARTVSSNLNRVALCGLMMFGAGTIGNYIATYTTTFALATLHMPARSAFAAGIVPGIVGLALGPLAGHFSDRVGRRPVVLLGMALAVILTIPAFALILRFPSLAMLCAMIAVASLSGAISASAVIVSLAEAFPPHRRSVLLSCLYAAAICIFGGSTQFVVTWLIDHTGNAMMPAYYRTASAAIGLLAAFMMPETSPGRASKLVARPAA